MTTLLVIMAHAEAQETYDRHLPLWKAHRCDTIVFCPADAPINTGLHMLTWGKRSHHDAEANRRFKRLIEFIAMMSYDRYVIFEYDALCLTAEIPTFFERSKERYLRPLDGKDFSKPYLAANVFRDNGPDRKFKGSTFCHPPLILTRLGLKVLLPHLNALPDDAELGFWDRMLGLACENAGIEPFDFMKAGLGYAQNTIKPHQWQDAYAAAANGAVFFHGVKCFGALDHIQSGHRSAKLHGKLREGSEIAI